MRVAGIVRALMTSVFTQQRVQPPSVDTRPEPSAWVASDVMNLDCEFVPAEHTVAALWADASRKSAPAYVVGTPSHLVGVVSRERLADAVDAGILSEPVASLVDARLVHGHADHPAEIVLDRLAHSHGVLPIVSREQATRMVGVVTVDHIWRFIQRRRAPVSMPSRRSEDRQLE